MTYRQLLHSLLQCTTNQLDCDVTVMDHEEVFYPATLKIYDCEDVLFKGHPYFISKTNGG